MGGARLPLGEKGQLTGADSSEVLMAMPTLCRVGAQPPTGAEDRACLGECAPGALCVVRPAWAGWGLTRRGADVYAFPQWT